MRDYKRLRETMRDYERLIVTTVVHCIYIIVFIYLCIYFYLYIFGVCNTKTLPKTVVNQAFIYKSLGLTLTYIAS